MRSRKLPAGLVPLPGFEAPPPPPREGAIGKVERLLREHPWLTVAQIAAEIREPADRVSNALNKLKHEGKAQLFEQDIPRRFLWADTDPAGSARRHERRREVADTYEIYLQDVAALKASKRIAAAWIRAGVRAEVAEA